MAEDDTAERKINRVLALFESVIRSRGSQLGHGLVDAEHWTILNTLRQFAAEDDIAFEELTRFCAGVSPSKLRSRLRNLERKHKYVELGTGSGQDESKGVIATSRFVKAFDAYLLEFSGKYAELYCDHNELPRILATVRGVATPLSRRTVSELLHPWKSYSDLWRALVQDMFRGKTKSKQISQLKLRFYSDETSWYLLMSLPLGVDGPQEPEYVNINEIVRAVARYATPQVSKIRLLLQQYMRLEVITENVYPGQGVRLYRLRPEVRRMLVGHLVDADALFREAAGDLLPVCAGTREGTTFGTR